MNVASCRVKQDLYAAMSAKQSALQLLQEREQQLSAVSTTAHSCRQQLDELQRLVAVVASGLHYGLPSGALD